MAASALPLREALAGASRPAGSGPAARDAAGGGRVPPRTLSHPAGLRHRSRVARAAGRARSPSRGVVAGPAAGLGHPPDPGGFVARLVPSSQRRATLRDGRGPPRGPLPGLRLPPPGDTSAGRPRSKGHRGSQDVAARPGFPRRRVARGQGSPISSQRCPRGGGTSLPPTPAWLLRVPRLPCPLRVPRDPRSPEPPPVTRVPRALSPARPPRVPVAPECASHVPCVSRVSTCTLCVSCARPLRVPMSLCPPPHVSWLLPLHAHPRRVPRTHVLSPGAPCESPASPHVPRVSPRRVPVCFLCSRDVSPACLHVCPACRSPATSHARPRRVPPPHRTLPASVPATSRPPRAAPLRAGACRGARPGPAR